MQKSLVTSPQMQTLLPAIELFSQRQKMIFESLELINSSQLSSISKSIEIMIAPYVQMQESLKLLTDKMNKQVLDALKSATAVKINVEFFASPPKTSQRTISLPSTYVVSPVDPSVISVKFDELGFVWVDGNKIVRANARGSQHGRLFKFLEGKKGAYVTKVEMRQAINKSSSAEQAIKDIQKVLRSNGFEMSYEPVHGDGLKYNGVIRKQ